jgi:hypothetical protein
MAVGAPRTPSGAADVAAARAVTADPVGVEEAR